MEKMGSQSEVSGPVINHPKLSTTFHGLRHPISLPPQEVWQFRGIKYASISARFKQSALNETFNPVYDASTYGPKCPQPHFPLRLEDGLIGLPHGIASHSEDIFDEFNCLNLNITTPAGVSSDSNLPVIVYIHGGGGFSGSNGDWWCDGSSIVKRSMEIGKPVVAVAINYRLSVLGYIGSEELATEFGKKNNGNQGPRDVYTALTWLTKHITPFGGNPTNLTIYGESHGSVLVNTLMHSSLPALPITRAIMQSSQLGTSISTPQALSYQNKVYNSIKASLNISTLEELQEVGFERLLEAYTKCDPGASVQAGLLVDGWFLKEDWKDNLGFQGDIMIGTNGGEECVLRMVCGWYPRAAPAPVLADLVTKLSSILNLSKIQEILMAYGIDEATRVEELANKLLNIAADIVFYKPAYDHVSRWEKERAEKGGIQQYIFEQLQPFTGPFKGEAAHSLDLSYLHGDPVIFSATENLETERGVQKGLQDAWIHFANGEVEWGGNKGVVRRFGPNEIVDEAKQEVAEKWRRQKEWKELEGLTDEEEAGAMRSILGFVGCLIGFESA